MGERRRRSRCPWPEKAVYRFKPEAEAARRSAEARYGDKMESYLCACGSWHLSRIKKPKNAIRRHA